MTPVDISTLNEEQQKAVRTTEGRLLILAGAGSGKTRTLTYRMAYLLGEKGVDPEQILGLTFTNKAASEMRQRVGQMVDGKKAKKITLRTFHSFCLQILREEAHRLGYTNAFTIYDEQDTLRVVTNIARDLLNHESEMPSIAGVMAAIGRARASGAEEIDGAGSDWLNGFAQKIYVRLVKAMRSYNAVDFDSLLTLTVQLFKEHPDVLEKYQERYRYLMIDEYQDTNPIQSEIVDLLAARYGNLCVVGDDDQSIYGWRGAEVRNILQFEHATTIKLEQNYRSNNTILRAANAVIGNNSERHGKHLWSAKGDGKRIKVFVAPTEINEAHSVVCRMDQLRKDHGLKWRDMAVLYRSNALSRQIEQALLKHSWKDGNEWVRGVPYQIFGGLEFYRRKEVKDLLGYLRVIANPQDQEALLRVINQPRRGIGDAALEVLTTRNREKKVPLWNVLHGDLSDLSARAQAGVRDFIEIIEETRKALDHCLREGVESLLHRINYQKAIADEVKSDKMRAIKWENVQELVSAVAEYEDQSNDPSLIEFIRNTPLGEDRDDHKKKEEQNTVSVLTIHSSKGLEWPACFLIGLEDQVIPHERSLKEGGLEEERRLMYVGITRAMEHLTISMAQKRMRMGKTMPCKPSRFLHEIPNELLKPERWDS